MSGCQIVWISNDGLKIEPKMVLWSKMSGIQMVCLIKCSDHLKTGQDSVQKFKCYYFGCSKWLLLNVLSWPPLWIVPFWKHSYSCYQTFEHRIILNQNIKTFHFWMAFALEHLDFQTPLYLKKYSELTFCNLLGRGLPTVVTIKYEVVSKTAIHANLANLVLFPITRWLCSLR